MGYDVTIHRIGAMALFDLKGPREALMSWAGADMPPLPEVPNTYITQKGIDVLLIGRDHWLVLAPLTSEQDLSAGLRPGEAPVDLSVVRISDTLCFFGIAGPDADQIMSIACPLDTHPSAFPEQGATYTDAFGLKALVMRRETGFWLAVEQSFGDMIEDYLARATN